MWNRKYAMINVTDSLAGAQAALFQYGYQQGPARGH